MDGASLVDETTCTASKDSGVNPRELRITEQFCLLGGHFAGQIQHLENKIVDEKAIFATGHSSEGLFSYRLAKETDLFAAVSPMSCGMAKDAHEPDKRTKPIPIFQVIGDKDKSYHGSTNPKIIMYSAAERIEIWHRFNQCSPDPVVVEQEDEIVVDTYACPSGVEVVLLKVKNQGHHIRGDLRDRADSIAIEFLLKHKGK